MSPPSHLSPPSNPYHPPLLNSLTTINTHNPPVHTCSTGWSFNGLLSGPTSVAYLFYKLSVLYPGEVFKGQEFGEWAGCYLELGRFWSGTEDGGGRGMGVGCEGVVGRVVRGVVEGDEGVVGEVCMTGLRVLKGGGASSGRLNGPCRGVSWGGGTGAAANGEASDNMNENSWTSGRAGYLYLLRVLRTRFPGSKTKIQTTIDRVINDIIKSDAFTSDSQTVTMANIHIITGITTQIILSRLHNHIDGLEETITEILVVQNVDGSWNETTPWIINSLASIQQHLPPRLQSQVTMANERARSYLYHADPGRSPPTLEPNGLVTRALAFSSMGDDRFHEVIRMVGWEWLDENRDGWRREAGKRDQWVGLGTGEAGRAWGWVVGELSGSGGAGSGGGVERRILGYNDV